MATPRRTPRSPCSAASPSAHTPQARLDVPLRAEPRVAMSGQLSLRDGSPASRRSRHAVRSGNRRPIESAAPVATGTSPRTACLERRPVGTRSPPVPRSPSARRVFAHSGTPLPSLRGFDELRLCASLFSVRNGASQWHVARDELLAATRPLLMRRHSWRAATTVTRHCRWKPSRPNGAATCQPRAERIGPGCVVRYQDRRGADPRRPGNAAPNHPSPERGETRRYETVDHRARTRRRRPSNGAARSTTVRAAPCFALSGHGTFSSAAPGRRGPARHNRRCWQAIGGPIRSAPHLACWCPVGASPPPCDNCMAHVSERTNTSDRQTISSRRTHSCWLVSTEPTFRRYAGPSTRPAARARSARAWTAACGA